MTIHWYHCQMLPVFILYCGVRCSLKFLQTAKLAPVILSFACYFQVNPFSRTTEKSPMLDHWGLELRDFAWCLCQRRWGILRRSQGGKPMFPAGVTIVKQLQDTTGALCASSLKLNIYIYTYIFYCFFMYTIYTMCQTPSTRPLLSWRNPKHDKQLRTTRRKFKQSKWRAFVTWLAFQSNGARCICASISPYPPLSPTDSTVNRPPSWIDALVAVDAAKVPKDDRGYWYPEVSWLDQLKSHKSRPWPYKNHEKSSKIEGSFFFEI